MAGKNDWLPRDRAGQLTMAKRWYNYLEDKTPIMGVTGPDLVQLGIIIPQIDTAEAAIRDEGGSDVLRGRLKDLYEELETEMRKLHRILTSRPLTHEELVVLDLRAHDTNPTAEPVPTTVPEIEVITATIRELGFRFRDYGAKTWALPDYVHGIEFKWHILEARPEHISALTNVELISSGPFTLQFDENQRGKRVFFAARWLNSTKKAGPWSDIESAVIP